MQHHIVRGDDTVLAGTRAVGSAAVQGYAPLVHETDERLHARVIGVTRRGDGNVADGEDIVARGEAGRRPCLRDQGSRTRLRLRQVGDALSAPFHERHPTDHDAERGQQDRGEDRDDTAAAMSAHGLRQHGAHGREHPGGMHGRGLLAGVAQA